MIATPRAWQRQVDSWIDYDCGCTEGRLRWELYETAMSWWWDRELDTGYLSHGPRIAIWRTNDDIHRRWTTRENEDRGVPVFVVQKETLR